MDQRIISLYDEYTHMPLGRDQFIKKLIQLTGSLAAAMAVIPLLEGNYAVASTTSDNELFTEKISYPSSAGEMMAYVARPKEIKKYPGVIVIHENRGLNAHIEDVTRRAASEGFLAIAPDGLSTLGGTPSNEDQARELFSKLDANENITRFAAALTYLKTRSDCNGAVGCVGFCWGGGMSNNLAVSVPELKASVVFYGRQPDLSLVSHINAAVQLHYAGLDDRINAGMNDYEAALKDAGVRYEQYVYPNVNHAFHNDTSAARFNKEAATLAWSRTISFLKKYVVI